VLWARGVYYVQQGAEAAKFFVTMEGGGWCTMDGGDGCSTTDSCHNRSLGGLGSTSGDSEAGFWINKNGDGSSYLSTNATTNPSFHNWTMVYLRYCDGSSFSGLATAPVPGPPGKPVFHSGNFILRGVIAELVESNGLGKHSNK
jgi:hypothetical protein